MNHRLTSVSLLASMALLSACDRSPEASSKPSPTTSSNSDFTMGKRVHKMLWRDPHSPVHSSTSPPGAQLSYYGGQVISNVNVVAVFWGSSVDPLTTSNIGGFFSSVTNSPYFDWLSEYNTNITAVNGQPGTNQSIGRGSYAGAVTITPSNPSTSLQDSDIQAEIENQINAGVLPSPDANTLYMTYFPAGTTISQGGSNSCVAGGFCAYHGTFTHNGSSTYYGVMPDMGPGSGCDVGCGSGAQFDNETSVSSHEMIEAVTDAEVGLATSLDTPLAWYDSSNGEIGDICNAQHGSIAGYTVQLEFSNARNDCVLQ